MADPFSDSNKSIFQKYVDACNRKLANKLEHEDRLRAIVDACDLYVLMQQNPEVRDSETLTGKKRKLLAILRRELKELQSEKRKSTGKLDAGSDSTASENTETTIFDPPGFDPPGLGLDPLGESVAPASKPPAAQQTAAQQPDAQQTDGHRFDDSAGDHLAEGELQQELLTLQSQSKDWELAYRLSSGPSQMLVRAGGATVGDPTELITLIQTTITPNVWDVNGGPATIGYYQRVHALVVRAPWSTHLGTQDLLKRFRE